MEFLKAFKRRSNFQKTFPPAYCKNHNDLHEDIEDLEDIVKERDAIKRSLLNLMLKGLIFERVIEPDDEIYQKMISLDDCQTIVDISDATLDEDQCATEKRKAIEQILANAPNV